MLHSKTNWRSPEADPEQVRELARSLSVSPLLSHLLVTRGLDTAEDALRFMDGKDGARYDPYLLKGMSEAVPRIRRALNDGEHILVYGDYDADGVSSTSLMIYLLRHLGASFDIYIPHRSNEGYGLHNHALDWALQQGVSLVITVDTGISARSQIAYAAELGIDVIVTDHHEPPELLPDAYALINPKLPYCPYPFKGLAGVGVALKLAEALLGGDVPEAWTEIAAIGTVADLMPLQDENREIVRRGIASMRRTRFPGIRALLDISGCAVEAVSAINIAFGMAPRINASGRLDHAGRAVQLLTTESREEAERLAAELDMLNKERQLIVERIAAEAAARMEERIKTDGCPSVIVLAGEGWNVGVVGIVASKLLERYYRPVLILDIHPDTGMCKGSARSIPGFDIYEALCSCSHLMDHFGGHTAAAGMSLHKDNLGPFAAALEAYADGVLTAEHLVPVTLADGEHRLADLSLKAADELERLAPFGMANPQPKFIVRGAVVKEARTMGQGGKHLKLVLQQDGVMMDTLAFGKGDLCPLLPAGTLIDVLGELSVNEWNGTRKPQLMLQDLAVPAPQLFDLRGVPDTAGRAHRLRELLSEYSGRESRRVSAVFRRERKWSPQELEAMELWVYDKDAGILPQAGHEIREDMPVALLCLLDMPESPEQLDALLAAFPKAENVALLHSVKDIRERLQVPTREHFKLLYKWIASIAKTPTPEHEVLLRLSRESSLSLRMLRMMLEVFEELEFIARDEGTVTFVTKPAARSLDTSPSFQRLSRMAEMERIFIEGSPSQLQEWMFPRTLGVS